MLPYRSVIKTHYQGHSLRCSHSKHYFKPKAHPRSKPLVSMGLTNLLVSSLLQVIELVYISLFKLLLLHFNKPYQFTKHVTSSFAWVQNCSEYPLLHAMKRTCLKQKAQYVLCSFKTLPSILTTSRLPEHTRMWDYSSSQ